MNKNKICIYHGNCADGFTAAWIVRKALGNDIDFYPGFYQQPPPDTTDKIVYMVDFSYKKNVMVDILSKARRVIHIDHHDTAIRDLEDINPSNLLKCYSPLNTESGAMLTWKYFYPNIDVPQLIKHIDDRDRWEFLLPGTREIQSNIFSYEYTFENWDMLMEQHIDLQLKEGTAIERKHAKDIRELMGAVVRRMNIGGYNVPVANVSYMLGSDMCHMLCKNEPFAGYYYDTPDFRIFGLRSSQDGIHVGDIAVQYGGGGHEHASGFRLTYDTAKNFEI